MPNPFTQNAEKALTWACQEAEKSGSKLSTEHLLMGLLQEEDSIAITMLTLLGTTRQAVLAALKPSMMQGETSSSHRFKGATEGFQRVMRLIAEEAGGLGSVMGTQDILIGLVRDGEGPCGQVLRDLELGLEQIRAAANQAKNTYGEEKLVPERVRHPVSSLSKEQIDDAVNRSAQFLLQVAIDEKATEILIEPKKGDVLIRHRVDGVLTEFAGVPDFTEVHLVSRFKVMAGLIDDECVPQKGQIAFRHENNEYLLSARFSQSKYGEKVSVTVTYPSNHV